jgi:hypothetical protein
MPPQRTPKQERDRAYRLLTRYGITLANYDDIKAVQGGCCPICTRAKGISAPLQVDHNHDTGEVRGLLCGRDNNRLGWFEAKRENILRYLDDPPARAVLLR